MNGPIAFYRRLYGPCLVYTATMIFSIFYHACDQESFSGSLPSGLQLTCLSLYVNNEVLQFCDFFSAILSFWVTVSFYFLNLFQQDWDSIPNCEQFSLWNVCQGHVCQDHIMFLNIGFPNGSFFRYGNFFIPRVENPS